MNVTTGYVSNDSFASSNCTACHRNDHMDADGIIKILRDLHIKEFYGEHFHLIFVVCFAVCIIGYITNALNVIVFSRMSLSNSMNLFLLILSISDLALISTQFAHVVNYFEGFSMYPFYSNYLFDMIGLFLESFFDNICNWMVAIVGVWGYVVVMWPQKCAGWFTEKRVKILIILLIVFSILLTCPMFLLFTYETLEFKGYVFYDKTYTDFAKSNDFLPLKIYKGFLLLRGLVPMIVMGISTGGLVWSLCKTNQTGEKITWSYKVNVRITIMLTVLLVLFLLSNLPDSFMILISVVSEGDSELHKRYRHATDIIRVFMLANDSLSFFIYYGLGHEFRKKFKSIFFCCNKSKTKEESVVESTVGNADVENGDVTETTQRMATIRI